VWCVEVKGADVVRGAASCLLFRSHLGYLWSKVLRLVMFRAEKYWREHEICVDTYADVGILLPSKCLPPAVQWTHRSVTRYGRGVLRAAKLHVPIFSGLL
jgi:hypothetical protein